MKKNPEISKLEGLYTDPPKKAAVISPGTIPTNVANAKSLYEITLAPAKYPTKSNGAYRSRNIKMEINPF